MKLGDYTAYGYCYHKNFFKEEELLAIEPILLKFHNAWLEDNAEVYAKQGILNSHSLTASKKLTLQEKKTLFEFIASDKIYNLIPFEQPDS